MMIISLVTSFTFIFSSFFFWLYKLTIFFCQLSFPFDHDQATLFERWKGWKAFDDDILIDENFDYLKLNCLNKFLTGKIVLFFWTNLEISRRFYGRFYISSKGASHLLRRCIDVKKNIWLKHKSRIVLDLFLH